MRTGLLPYFLILILNTLCALAISGQTIVDPELQSLFTAGDTSHHDHLKPLRESQTEITMTLSVAFFLYKELISSQDLPKCIFSPSCSEYSIEAFQKKGIVVGWLSTFDRLSRCHGFVGKDHYPFDFKKNRFYDPVH